MPMTRGRLLHRLVTLVAWTSPLLLLVLVFGVGTPKVTTATPTSQPSAPSSSLANSIRGQVGGHEPTVVVPIETTRPWILHAPATVQRHLRCGATSLPVTGVVTAPKATCVLVLAATRTASATWTLELLP